MNRDTKVSSALLFLLGLGSATKIFLFGALAISELVIFLIVPFLFLKQFKRMRREGFLTFIYMLGLIVGGMFVSAIWNHTPFPYVFKQFAVFYGYFSYYLVFYILLHNNFKGIGWFFVGVAISEIITIWAFNLTTEVSSAGYGVLSKVEAEQVINGPLFWVGRIRRLGELPMFMEYLKTPLAYSLLFPLVFVGFALAVSISGRAQSMCVLVGWAMLLLGRKSQKSMGTIGRHTIAFLIVGMIMLIVYKCTYSYAARNGLLSSDAQTKYEHQTEQGTGALAMLMSGRTEFFIALMAIKDHPIVGFGPAAEDKYGYTEKFLAKYGTYEDIQQYYFMWQYFMYQGVRPMIPTHSHLMAGWVWCGLPGAIFFVWMLFVLYKHIKCYLAAIPQWFGYFALTIPSMVWSIFFNPFGVKWNIGLLMACIYFARAVGTRKMILPYELEMEVQRHG